MLLLFVVTNLIVAAAANPFHKYPYVFLLDVGNEEIQDTISEQIRVSIPGGSLALKYPAIPGTDAIAHVRVSGIDFGTDLKTNIIDGGPGYNYVVLMFNGNPGVTYDAVITIEFAGNSDLASVNTDDDDDDDDENSSAEDTSELDSSGAFSEKQSKEALISSSNVYSYANKGVVDVKYKDDEQNEDSSDSIEDSNSDESESDQNIEDNQPYDEQIVENDSPGANSDKIYSNNQLRSKYVSYESFRPRLYGGVRIYPQAGLYIDNYNSRPAYDPVNHDADENTVYDDSGDKFRDANNNIKLGYSLAME